MDSVHLLLKTAKARVAIEMCRLYTPKLQRWGIHVRNVGKEKKGGKPVLDDTYR